ncbi:restriction endonuclease [Neolewinella persica]|uniref:restriction endonuclease n=1 Tax=Neolewinella persica TaxID=70998 RepID=UPI0003793B0C|nr:restriction endonuclease [Neolewinella persica]
MLYKDPPEVDYFPVDTLGSHKFSDEKENWMFFTDLDEHIVENLYFEVNVFFNNFKRKPGAVAILEWKYSRWMNYNPIPHISMRDALDYVVRQVLLTSLESKGYGVSLSNYFESDMDYRMMDVDYNPNFDEDEFDDRDFDLSYSDREISIILRYEDNDRYDHTFLELYKITSSLLKKLIADVNTYSEFMMKSRKYFLERTVSLKDFTIPYLIAQLRNAKTNDQKGKSLEELCAFFLQKISGFTVKERIITSNEEIDIVVYNGSELSPWKSESNFILAECKNWTKKVGKNEYVVFRDKLVNRSGRAEIGIFISTSGYTKGFYKARIRNSRDRIIILDITTDEIIECLENGIQAPSDFLEQRFIETSME